MNYLLQLNKKFVLLFLFFLIILTFWILFIQKSYIQKQKFIKSTESISYDIIDPKFTINNKKEKILVKASEGNFIDNNKILLKNNVIFKSKKFTIKSSEVFFDKINQTAYTKHEAIFSSEGTKINSKGFEIKNNGTTIVFNGKTKIILKK